MALGLGISTGVMDSGGNGKDIRPPSLNLDGVDDLVHGTAGDSEFDSWSDFTIVMFIENNKHPYLESNHLISLGDSFSYKKGFDLYFYSGNLIGSLGDGSSGSDTAIVNLNLALNHPKGRNQRILVGFKGDASENEITAFGYTIVKGYEETTTSFTYSNWGDVGANVSLVVGGKDSNAGTSLAITEDWGGGGIHNVAMWKSVLTEANVTSLWNGGIPMDYEGILGSAPDHYWKMNNDDARLGYPKDRGSATAKNLAFAGSSKISKLQELNP
tara:strand:+ start:10327 stop:11139 length:813 start_codon:yes stop_codon:yes gene_type:complete